MAVYSTQRAEAKKKVNDIYDLQTEQVHKTADAGIKDISTAYDDQQRAVAVQKLINERKVAESMANLGLTDSGLNRTQQTAVQLSAANAAYNLNRQKQADINAYNLDRDSKLSTIEQNRIAAVAGVDETYDGLEAEYSVAQAKAAAEASAAAVAAQEKASQIISKNNGILNRNYTGTLAENGISVEYDLDNGKTTYIDRNTGYKTTFNRDTNPYTNTVNPDTKNGAFKNGYQPNNIDSQKLTVHDKFANDITGLKQNIYEYQRDDDIVLYFIWDGSINDYVQVVKTWHGNKSTYRSTGKSVTELREAKAL